MCQPPHRVACWQALTLFSGWGDLLDDLVGENINRIENIMTLSLDAHDVFGKMQGWLEAREAVIQVDTS